jgi:hypothetical protein
VTLSAALVAVNVWAADRSILTPAAKDQLAGNLRGLLLEHLPTPLYEASPNWGHQANSKRVHVRGRFRDWHLEMNHEPRNDGVWRRIRVTADNPADTLVFDIRNIAKTPEGPLAFQIFVALNVNFEFQQQRWESGFRLFDLQARGRARVRLTLDCLAASRVETREALPELVIDAKVAKADVGYDNLKFVHIAGLGGEAAEIIGEAAQTIVRQWRPSIERDLLAKANAAIVKAGEHKEVRLSLQKLFNSSK